MKMKMLILVLVGVALVAASSFKCGAPKTPVRPIPPPESAFGFRSGDARIDPAFVDLDGDGRPEYILVIKYEKTRNKEGYTQGNCNTAYTVEAALVVPGSNGNRGRSWFWCATELPHDWPGTASVIRVEGGKVYIKDNLLRWLP